MLPLLREKELVDLLLIPIRKHKYARAAAFKVSARVWGDAKAMDYLLGLKEAKDAEDFIDKKGLKYVFPALVGEVELEGNGDA